MASTALSPWYFKLKSNQYAASTFKKQKTIIPAVQTWYIMIHVLLIKTPYSRDTLQVFHGLFWAKISPSRPVYRQFTALFSTAKIFFTACFELFGGGHGHLATLQRKHISHLIVTIFHIWSQSQRYFTFDRNDISHLIATIFHIWSLRYFSSQLE